MPTREAIWVVPSGGQNEYGDNLPSGDPRYIPGAIVLPRKSSENADRGVVIISGYEIFLKPPPLLPISATDAILVRGEEQQVDGKPGLYVGKALQLFTTSVGA